MQIELTDDKRKQFIHSFESWIEYLPDILDVYDIELTDQNLILLRDRLISVKEKFFSLEKNGTFLNPDWRYSTGNTNICVIAYERLLCNISEVSYSELSCKLLFTEDNKSVCKAAIVFGEDQKFDGLFYTRESGRYDGIYDGAFVWAPKTNRYDPATLKEMDRIVELVKLKRAIDPDKPVKVKKLKATSKQVEDKAENFDKQTEIEIQKEITEKENKMAATDTPKKTTPSTLSKVTDKVKAAKVIMAQDALEATKRLAVDEILTLTHEALANVLVAKLEGAERDSVKRSLMESMASPEGAAFMALMVGGAMTAASDMVPEEYSDIYDDIAREFRVNSQVRAGKMLLDLLRPLIGNLFTGATKSLANVVKAKEELIKVQPLPPAPTESKG